MTKLMKETNWAFRQIEAEMDGADLAQLKKIRARLAKLDLLAARVVEMVLEEAKESA